MERMAVRGGLNPLSGLICLEELLLNFLGRVRLLNRRRLSVAFTAIQIDCRKADVAISFSVSSGKSFEVRDVTD